MITGSARVQRWQVNIIHAAAATVRWIIEPSPKVEPKQRWRIRMLSVFLLIMSINTMAGMLILNKISGDAWLVLEAASATLFVGYLVSRTRYYRAALVVAIAVPALPPLAIAYFRPPEVNLTAELMWLALPLIVATLMLSLRQIVIIVAFYIAFIIALRAFGLMELRDMAPVLGFLSIFTFFVLAISVVRRKDQTEIENQLIESVRAYKLHADEIAVLTLLGRGAELKEILDATTILGEAHNVSIKGSVLLVDDSRERLYQIAAPNLPLEYQETMKDGIPIGPNMGACGTAAYSKGRVIIEDIEHNPNFPAEAAMVAVRNGLRAVWSQPIIASNGEILGTIANYSDKTGAPDPSDLRVIEWSAKIAALAIESKRAEKAIKESEELLRENNEQLDMVLNSVPCGILVIDTETYIIQDANIYASNMIGAPAEEIIGKECHQFICPAERGKCPVTDLGEDVDHSERTLVNIKGDSIPILKNIAHITIGKNQYLLETFIDITELKRMEAALADEATRRRILIEQSRDGIVILDQKGAVYEANRRFADMLGYSPEEVLKLNVWDWEFLYPPEQVREMIRTVDEAGDHFITQHKRKDGTTYDVEISTNGAMFAGQKLIFCVCRDISERTRMEKALKESEEKFSKAFHSSPDAIAITTLKDGKYIEVNDSYIQFTGYTSQELIGRRSTDISIWANPKTRARMLKTLKEQGKVRNEEYNIRMKSGEIRTWLFSAENIDIAGEPCLIGVSVDITERKRAEEVISEREKRFSDIAENAMEWIWEVDATGKYTYSSPVVEKILEYNHEEILKKHFYDLFLPEEREELKKAAFAAFAQKQPIKDFINKNRCKNGKTVELLTSGVPVIDEAGNLQGYRGVDTDITERRRAEQALKESEEKFSAAFRSSPNTMAITRVKDGKFIEVNDSHTRITGYTPEETIGHTSIELGLWVNEEDRVRMLEILKKNGRVNSEEFEFRIKSGEIRTWLFSAERLTIGGEPCITSNTVDITERKRTERLQNDENYVLTLLGRGVELSELLDSIVRLGESHDPAIKGSAMLYDAQKQFLFPAATPSLPASYSKLMENGIPVGQNMGACGTAAYLKKRVTIPDIRNTPIFPKEVAEQTVANGLLACWSQPIIASNGDLLGTIANYSSKTGKPSASDIRVLEWSAYIAAIAIERKQAEAALRESEEKFYKAFHASPDVIAIIRMKDSKFIEVNENFVRFNGYPREEVIGHTATELGIWANAEERNRILKMMKEQGNVSNEEFHMRTKSGEIHIGLFSAAVTNFGGEPCFIAITTDITERKRMEVELKQALAELEQSSAQLAATNKELEAFSYSVSHDLRAPLRSIDGFSQALLEDYEKKLDRTGQDYLRRLRAASQKMGELIDGILKLSRLTRSEMRHVPIDLSALAEEIANRLQEMQPERRVKFAIAKELTANGDPQLLRVLLENLLDNAWKFTSKKPRAKIEFSMNRNNGKKTFYIRDNGVGFDMTYADRLFSAFQRLHEATEFPGTGIGLATVKRIIHRHGGTIWAEGAVGKGATFHFTLD